jgi:hypothetical protein
MLLVPFRSCSASYADGAYQGPEFQAAMKQTVADVNVEIVRRSDGAEINLL